MYEHLMAVYEKKEGSPLVFQPRLRHWYDVNYNAGTLPERYQGMYLDEVYRDFGEPELGFVLCAGDEPAIISCNPRLAFKRAKVLMNGDEVCDHVFYVKEG